MTTVFVTAGQVPSQTQVVTVFASSTQAVATSVAANISNSSEQSLPLSWIIAIIALVLLAIESTVLFVFYIKRNRQNLHRDNERNYRPQSRYYEMSRSFKNGESRLSTQRFDGSR